ncbi:MAG: DUF1559 domain-containing protein [Planctomycetia bacterium]|nr:DUF1559 domain-containing protein [Planctomycetia bacterium]
MPAPPSRSTLLKYWQRTAVSLQFLPTDHASPPANFLRPHPCVYITISTKGAPRKRARSRRAITLTDVLVTITALSLLLLLLAPMIGCSRENQRQQTCALRLKQLATTFHLYHDNNLKLPTSAFYQDRQNLAQKDVELKTVVPGKTGKMKNSAPYSFLVRLFPYIDLKPPHNDLPFDKNEAFAPENYTLAAKSVPGFLCPSFSGKPTSQAVDYTPPAGVEKPALTNYKALGATTLACLQDFTFVGMPYYNGGVIHPHAAYSFNNLRAITQTALLTETKEQKYAAWWDGTTASIPGFHPGTGNVGDDRMPSPPVAAPALNIEASGTQKSFITHDQFGGKEDMQWGPSSDHPGLVNHAMVGTEVRAISNDIDPVVYSALISRRDDDNRPLEDFIKQNR